jgi:hypothetical protein
MDMTRFYVLSMGVAATALLSGCIEGVRPYVKSPDTVIAVPYDSGSDKGGLEDGNAAIVYDPDGCQGWLIDDGLEGYSGRRYDPLTGLPVCNDQYPPGTVINDYQSQSPGLADSVPRPGKKK